MGRGPHCSEERREIICNMKANGSSVTEIFKQLQCSRKVIHNALRHVELYGNAKNVARAPRPRKTTKKEDSLNYRASAAHPFSSSKAIKSSVFVHHSICVSDRTIRRRLQQKKLERMHRTKKATRDKQKF